MDSKRHWDNVYTTKTETDVSWYQREPAVSLALIRAALPKGGSVIDIGGGASVLVDRLLEAGYQPLAVLDVAESALARSRARLGERAGAVRWIVADVTAAPALGRFDLWHDRAVFHFLTDAPSRSRYAELARGTIAPGGHLVIATFAPDGPPRCSGLDVCRYDARQLAAELGGGFVLDREEKETHATPGGKPQSFTYALLRRV